MHTLTGARLIQSDGGAVRIALDRGFCLSLHLLDAHLARILVTRPSGLRMPQSWSLSTELAGTGETDPIEGRDRLDMSDFPGTAFSVAESEAAIRIEFRSYRDRDPPLPPRHHLVFP